MTRKTQNTTDLSPQGRILAATTLVLSLGSCFASSAGSGNGQAVGDFVVVGTNLPPGGIWQINRPIKIEFNRAVDPASVHFGSVVFTPESSGVQGRPVTGIFTLLTGSEGNVIEFQPHCPTEPDYSDAAFLPGGHQYRLSLPITSNWSTTVLRDTDGRLLSGGLERFFRTPIAPVEPIFFDSNSNPPTVTSIDWPRGLNLFIDPDPPIIIYFDQSIGGSAENLSSERIRVLYSDQTISSGQPMTFSSELPGAVFLIANCNATGAIVGFHPSGILPPDRQLVLLMDDRFEDISGQRYGIDWQSPPHTLISLTNYYGAAIFGWNEGDETLDEFQENFLDASLLDPIADLPFPPAEVDGGSLHASFDYSGQFVPADADFYWDTNAEVNTDGRFSLFDSNGRAFLIDNGVLYVDDFTLEFDASIRFRGSNPVVIYAQGDVTILGDIDASGNDSIHPTSLNTPQFPEGPINGECGGGLGGASSQEGLKETLRGQSGDGAFGWVGQGGEGGEGGFQQEQGVGGLGAVLGHIIVGGGGGGTFAMTPNYSLWHRPWDFDQSPAGADNAGPDHIHEKNPYWPDGVWRDPALVGNLDLPIFGGEDGMRGSALDAIQGLDPNNPPTYAHGIYGMEDMMPDFVDPPDVDGSWDPPWNTPTKPFGDGHPTFGPDPGRAGPTIFDGDNDTSNDFWGRRLNNDGTVTVGELMAPWAGSGGGGSGDSQLIPRSIDQSTGILAPLIDSFPTRPFPPGSGIYRKGAPGAGGGGQMLIMAIGRITLGDSATIRANGGIGRGGEGTIGTTGQISGSGAGSGGHLVVHSATGLDLSQIDIGTAANVGELPLLNPRSILQAFGGRRGWAAGLLADVWGTIQPDGNGDLMVGRGGAGGNGIVQIHLPDPSNDIDWPLSASAAITTYLHNFDPVNNPIDMDRLEEILDLFASPKPFALLPFFSAKSQAQSVWVDTGAAEIRQPAAGTGPWPDYFDNLLRFEGIGVDGEVEVDSETVKYLPSLLEGSWESASFGIQDLVVTGASTVFAGLERFLRSPNLLNGFDILPAKSNTHTSFEIVAAEYDAVTDILSLWSNPSDGALFAGVVSGEGWALRPKFFRFDTLGAKDHLPVSTAVFIEFQGTTDPSDLSATVPSPGDWTADLSVLKGLRFFRWRITFDIDAADTGVSLTSPRPQLDYLKLPFSW